MNWETNNLYHYYYYCLSPCNYRTVFWFLVRLVLYFESIWDSYCIFECLWVFVLCYGTLWVTLRSVLSSSGKNVRSRLFRFYVNGSFYILFMQLLNFMSDNYSCISEKRWFRTRNIKILRCTFKITMHVWQFFCDYTTF